MLGQLFKAQALPQGASTWFEGDLPGLAPGIPACSAHNILVLGTRGVGKTSVVERIVAQDQDGPKGERKDFFEATLFYKDEEERLAINVNIQILRSEQTGSKLYRQFSADYQDFLKNADAFILVYSRDDQASFIGLLERLHDIRKLKSANTPVVVLENKSDIEKSALPMRNRDHFFLPWRCPTFSVSAKKNEGLIEAVEWLLRDIRKQSLP